MQATAYSSRLIFHLCALFHVATVTILVILSIQDGISRLLLLFSVSYILNLFVYLLSFFGKNPTIQKGQKIDVPRLIGCVF
jgi:hypothetical protein